MNNFYIYAHYKADTGEIFNIGKGQNKRAWSKYNRNKFWHNVISKHGLKIEILHDNLDEIFALELEANYIACYGRRNLGTGILVNMTDGYEGVSGYKHTKELKEKWRNNRKGKYLGINHPMYGKHHSEETKRKWSKDRKGKYPSIETRIKLSKSKIGNKNRCGTNHSEETKRKIGDGNKNKIISDETRRKISESKKGHIVSEETRRKISETKRSQLPL